VGFEVRVWWGGVFGNLEEKKELLREAMAKMVCDAMLLTCPHLPPFSIIPFLVVRCHFHFLCFLLVPNFLAKI